MKGPQAIFWFIVGLLIVLPEMGSAESPRRIGRVEAFDSRLNELFSSGEKFEVLASGFTWVEGPLWVPADSKVDGCDSEPGCLLFSDIPRNTIFRWRPGMGVDKFMSPSGYTGVTYYGLEPGSNGLALDPQGRLIMCEHGDRRVTRLSVGGGKLTLVDNYEGKRLNSPNDLTIDREGNLYFTDPPYGLPDRENDVRRELDFFGVYRLSNTGDLTLLTTELVRPNGIGLSPDGKTLYVAQSDGERPIWAALPIEDDGKAGPLRELADARRYRKEFPGAPDGLTVHSSGTLLGSGPGGVYVITPEGDVIGRLLTGGRVSNCALDADEKWLYITADKLLCRIRLR
ncbi:SMP-30/gluconolactonase/LRE family protein [Rhodopirellula sallentina]|uniref:Gluconolactonase (Precursor) n=1 Tax=Rhodopirellula sallentina SM41 TaxID=1263870 RepID=M5UB05_9BACT|nr:SMP-30/gluconolactonase/LRE family protein [Rhodopirellula sallentina]EMI58484.1 gluconolactonase (precursor) [Rhodopirellula sallentina SM41]